MSDYLDKIQTQKKDGTPISTVLFQDSAAREDITEIQNELTTDTTTIEGNPINFTTLSAQNAQSTIIDLEPIQDLHGYDYPWVGGAGKNKYSVKIGNDGFSDLKNATHTSSSGVLIISASAQDYSGCYSGPGSIVTTVIQAFSSTITYSLYIKTNKNATIQVGYEGYSVRNYNCTTDWQRITRTVTADGNTHIFIIYNLSGESVEISVKDFMLEEGSTIHDYEPYENICPISGRTKIGILGCRKNLLNPNISMASGYYNDDGVLQSSTRTGHSELLKTNPNTNYTLKLKVDWQSTRRFGFYFWDENKNWISRDTVDLVDSIKLSTITPSNCKYISLQLMIGDGATDVGFDISQSQLELGNQATTYEPYKQSNDLTISFGQTVYGGQVDVEKGLLVVDKAIYTFDGNERIEKNDTTNRFYTTSLSDVIKAAESVSEPANIICSHYGTISFNDANNGITGVYEHTNKSVGFYNENLVDKTVQEFATILIGVQLIYPLATPTVIQLSPNIVSLLKGVNNISTDGDKITLTYRDGSVATLADLLDLEKKLTDEEPYGFIEHMSILDPAQRIEYIGKNKNYKPMTVNLAGDHLANYNDWHEFFVLKENKPYMVKSDGTVDYALDPNDYTKKFDGSASDVADTTYTGGAFSWIPKIYKYEYVEGSDRYVYFSQKKLNDNYEAVGFIDENGLEHDGAWIPMFYGTEITQDGTVKIMSLATGTPSQSRDTATQKTYIENFSSQAKFFGGPIVNVLADLLIMLGKNSDIQAVFGTGNSSGGNDAQYMKANACLNGGAFYGTTTNNVLNKAFHSLVLLTQNQWQRDPYTLCYKGEYIVSPYYKYDLTGASYVNTGVFVTPPSSNNWVYPDKSVSVPHWGAVPVGPYSGSTTTGWADGQYTLATQLTDTTVRVVRRFGHCNNGRLGGVRCVNLSLAASYTTWNIGASPLLLSENTKPM